MEEVERVEYLQAPQPDEISEKERDDAMGSYLMMFASWIVAAPLPMINLIAAVIYYYVNKDSGNFVVFHMLQSLWSQLMTTAFNVTMWIWIAMIFFSDGVEADLFFWSALAFTILFNIIYFIISLLAAFRAKKGRFFYFLFFGRLAFHQAYSVKGHEKRNRGFRNEPPNY